MADISKITLPSGNTYDIKDQGARDLIASLQGGSYFLGKSTTALTDGATTNPIQIDGVTGTTTAVNGNVAVYGNAEFVFNGTKWIEFGDLSTLGELAYKDSVTLNKGNGINVLTTSATFSVPATTVTFSGGSTDTALGTGATFSTTVTPTTTNIKATASGTAVGANGTAAAITGFGAHTTDTFVKSVSAETNKKLVTTSITPTNGTETVSKVTKTASKLVTTTVPNVTGNTDVSIPNVTGNADKSWSVNVGTGTDAETLVFTGDFVNNTYTASDTDLGTNLSASKVTLGTAKTVATGAVASNGGGSDIVTAVTVSDKTVAKAGSAVTVATGATDANGEGDSIVTGVTIGSSAAAITALGTPTTSNCLTGVKVTTQPTIALATNATAGTGVISVATGITSASTTVDSADSVTAITDVGTGSVASQNVTVGGSSNNVKVAKYADLSVSVS